MNKTESIKQNTMPDVLPNFRNLGITLRILLLSNALVIMQALMLANGWSDVVEQIIQISTLFSPILLTELLILWAVQPQLNKLPYWRGFCVVMGITIVLSLGYYMLIGELLHPEGYSPYYFEETRYVVFSGVVSGFFLLYFRLRTELLSRALHDVRLQVLRARIRPHFLFNTINAVLGIVREQPKKAETALEDMADLFRMAMSDARDLVGLSKEIKLCQQYIALEQLRMGDRLQVDWQIQNIPEDALIPPLLLQPLLENAVYHGVEPLSEGGRISIFLQCSGAEIHLKVENPCPHVGELSSMEKFESDGTEGIGNGVNFKGGSHSHQSNQMALRNIRERLALLFDAEARYHFESGVNYYRVEIAFPYVSEQL